MAKPNVRESDLDAIRRMAGAAGTIPAFYLKPIPPRRKDRRRETVELRARLAESDPGSRDSFLTLEKIGQIKYEIEHSKSWRSTAALFVSVLSIIATVLSRIFSP